MDQFMKRAAELENRGNIEEDSLRQGKSLLQDLVGFDITCAIDDTISEGEAHLENQAPTSTSHSHNNRVLASKISDHLNAGNMEFDPTVDDDETITAFQPHILHKPHKPFPVAMVNRYPKGSKCLIYISVCLKARS